MQNDRHDKNVSDMTKMYDDVINLRNRLSIEGSGEVFEEDVQLLDRVLDLMETLF